MVLQIMTQHDAIYLVGSLTLSRSTSVINIPNSEHIHASDKYILSFISVRSFANKKGLIMMND